MPAHVINRHDSNPSLITFEQSYTVTDDERKNLKVDRDSQKSRAGKRKVDDGDSESRAGGSKRVHK